MFTLRISVLAVVAAALLHPGSPHAAPREAPAGRSAGLFSVRAWPVPADDGARILWTLARPAQVRVGIFDLSGHLLWNLRPENRTPGIYSVVWDARDALGRRVPAGVYLCRVESVDDFALTGVVVARPSSPGSGPGVRQSPAPAMVPDTDSRSFDRDDEGPSFEESGGTR